MESQPPESFFEQFLVNGAPGQNHSEKAARLLFPDYPNILGDDDDIPVDSPLMKLLRDNLPSMRAASSPVRSQRRKKGKGVQKRVDQSRSDSTRSKGSQPDGQSIAEIHTARRDFKRWLYTEKFAEMQRQRDHQVKMETMKLEELRVKRDTLRVEGDHN